MKSLKFGIVSALIATSLMVAAPANATSSAPPSGQNIGFRYISAPIGSPGLNTHGAFMMTNGSGLDLCGQNVGSTPVNCGFDFKYSIAGTQYQPITQATAFVYKTWPTIDGTNENSNLCTGGGGAANNGPYTNFNCFNDNTYGESFKPAASGALSGYTMAMVCMSTTGSTNVDAFLYETTTPVGAASGTADATLSSTALAKASFTMTGCDTSWSGKAFTDADFQWPTMDFGSVSLSSSKWYTVVFAGDAVAGSKPVGYNSPTNSSGGSSASGSGANAGLGAVAPSTPPTSGTSTTTVAGAAVATTTKANLTNRTVTTTSKGSFGGTLTYSAINGKTLQPLVANKALGVSPGSWIKVTGQTFKKKSAIQIYVINDIGESVYLGTLTANAAGRVNGKLQLPASTGPGKYTLQANGYTRTKDKVRSSNMGFEVAGAELGSLYFNADSAAATDQTKADAKAIAAKIGAGSKVTLLGFTAGSIEAKYGKANLKLANDRIATIQALFAAEGITSDVVLVPQGAEKGGHNKPGSRRVDVRAHN